MPLKGLPSLAGLLLLAGSVNAEQTPPRLDFPVDCEIGTSCLVQKYVDHSPDRRYRDYRCGHLSSNDHDGTDIRLADFFAMERGVDVLAAAEGTVIQTYDGMPDVSVRLVGSDAVTDRGLGNRVVIDHGDGWLTIYGHLRRGSIAVETGEQVNRGQRLGLVGMSGLSDAPHLHFAVWHRRVPIDPFVGPGKKAGCEAGDAPLWSAEALDRMPYIPTFVMHSGYATRPMARAAFLYGLYEGKTLPRRHGKLYFGIFVAGLYAGDAYAFTLRRDNGQVLYETSGTVSRNRPIQLFVLEYGEGTALPESGYDTEFVLKGTRNGEPGVVLRETRSVKLR